MFPSPGAPTGLGIVHVFDGVKCQLCHNTKICTCTCVTCDPTRERYEQTPQRLAERLAEAERENARLRGLLAESPPEAFLEDVALVTFAGLAFAAGIVESTRDVITSAWRCRRRIFGGR